jgi:hypothetical protein
LLASNSYIARKCFFELRARIGASDAHWQAATVAVEALDFKRALAQLEARYPSTAPAAFTMSSAPTAPTTGNRP